MPNPIKNPTTLAPTNTLFLNKCKLKIGSCAFFSINTNNIPNANDLFITKLNARDTDFIWLFPS